MHILSFLLPLALSSQITNALPHTTPQISRSSPILDRRTTRTAFSIVSARLRMFRTGAAFAAPCWAPDSNGKLIMAPCTEDACQIHSHHRDFVQLDCVHQSVEICYWFQLHGPECDKEDDIAEKCPQTDEQFIDKLMEETGYSREETARKWHRIMEFTALGYGDEEDFTCPKGAIDPIFHYNETIPEPVAAPVQAPAKIPSTTISTTTSTKSSPEPSSAPENAVPEPPKLSTTTTTTSSSTSTPSPSPTPSKDETSTESPHLIDPVHGPGYGLDQNGRPRRAGRPCYWNSGCSLLHN